MVQEGEHSASTLLRPWFWTELGLQLVSRFLAVLVAWKALLVYSGGDMVTAFLLKRVVLSPGDDAFVCFHYGLPLSCCTVTLIASFYWLLAAPHIGGTLMCASATGLYFVRRRGLHFMGKELDDPADEVLKAGLLAAETVQGHKGGYDRLD